VDITNHHGSSQCQLLAAVTEWLALCYSAWGTLGSVTDHGVYTAHTSHEPAGMSAADLLS